MVKNMRCVLLYWPMGFIIKYRGLNIESHGIKTHAFLSLWGNLFYQHRGFSRKSPPPNLLIDCFELVAGKNGTAISILGHNIYIIKWVFFWNVSQDQTSKSYQRMRQTKLCVNWSHWFLSGISSKWQNLSLYINQILVTKKAHCIICEDLQGRILQLLGKYTRK